MPVAQKASVTVGRGPEALVSDGQYLWVASQFTNTVSKVDGAVRWPGSLDRHQLNRITVGV